MLCGGCLKHKQTILYSMDIHCRKANKIILCYTHGISMKIMLISVRLLKYDALEVRHSRG